jgi:hypothetical protein
MMVSLLYHSICQAHMDEREGVAGDAGRQWRAAIIAWVGEEARLERAHVAGMRPIGRTARALALLWDLAHRMDTNIDIDGTVLVVWQLAWPTAIMPVGTLP